MKSDLQEKHPTRKELPNGKDSAAAVDGEDPGDVKRFIESLTLS